MWRIKMEQGSITAAIDFAHASASFFYSSSSSSSIVRPRRWATFSLFLLSCVSRECQRRRPPVPIQQQRRTIAVGHDRLLFALEALLVLVLFSHGHERHFVPPLSHSSAASDATLSPPPSRPAPPIQEEESAHGECGGQTEEDEGRSRRGADHVLSEASVPTSADGAALVAVGAGFQTSAISAAVALTALLAIHVAVAAGDAGVVGAVEVPRGKTGRALLGPGAETALAGRVAFGAGASGTVHKLAVAAPDAPVAAELAPRRAARALVHVSAEAGQAGRVAGEAGEAVAAFVEASRAASDASTAEEESSGRTREALVGARTLAGPALVVAAAADAGGVELVGGAVGHTGALRGERVVGVAGGAALQRVAGLTRVRAVAALAAGEGKRRLRADGVVHAAADVEQVAGGTGETAVGSAALTVRPAGLVAGDAAAASVARAKGPRGAVEACGGHALLGRRPVQQISRQALAATAVLLVGVAHGAAGRTGNALADATVRVEAGGTLGHALPVVEEGVLLAEGALRDQGAGAGGALVVAGLATAAPSVGEKARRTSSLAAARPRGRQHEAGPALGARGLGAAEAVLRAADAPPGVVAHPEPGRAARHAGGPAGVVEEEAALAGQALGRQRPVAGQAVPVARLAGAQDRGVGALRTLGQTDPAVVKVLAGLALVGGRASAPAAALTFHVAAVLARHGSFVEKGLRRRDALVVVVSLFVYRVVLLLIFKLAVGNSLVAVTEKFEAAAAFGNVLQDALLGSVEEQLPLLDDSCGLGGRGHVGAAVDVQRPRPVGRLAPEVNGQERPVDKALSGLVSRSRQQQGRLGAAGRRQHQVEGAPRRELQRDLALDVLQVPDLLGGSLAGRRRDGHPGHVFVAHGGDRHVRLQRVGLADELAARAGPHLRQPDHGVGVHQAVAELEAILPADTVSQPAGLVEQRLRVGRQQDDVLHVPPRQVGVGLEREGADAGRDGRACRRPRVVRRANLVLPQPLVLVDRRDALVVARRARRVGGGQRGGAFLEVPRLPAALRRRRDGQCKDGVGVAIAVAIVVLPTTVAARPDEDGPLAAAAVLDPLDEGLLGQGAGTVDCFAVVFWPPRS